MSASTIDTALLEKAVGELPRDRLTAARQEALQQFAETGFPTTRHEDWKYTNLKPAMDLSNLWLRDVPGPLPDAPRPVLSVAARRYAETLAAEIDAHWIVIFNGVVQAGSLAALDRLNLAGLEVAAVAADKDTRTGKALPAKGLTMRSEDPMSRFNAALLLDALQLRVTSGANLTKPLGLLVLDDANAATAVSQVRIVIDACDHARIKVIEHQASIGEGDHFANVVTEVNLAVNSTVDFVRIQRRDPRHYQIGRLTARIARDATLHHAAFDLGGGLIRNDLAANIEGPGGTVRLYGLYLASGKQHIDNHTRVDHRVGPATSVEEYRGIAADQARCVFNGKAIVHEGADGTDAQQSNHNLLLSDKAEIDTKPELEIYADDVKCSHGATVGQLDESALFYLRSRGLSRDDAARALTRAFAAGILAYSPIVEAHDYLDRAIDTRLQGLIDGMPT